MIAIPLIISLLTSWPLFLKGYFPMHDDLHVMRMDQLQKCFADGQIPCRWSPDMTYGYGQAMFNFYSAFPYYLGELINLITPFGIIDTVKILFIISLFASGLGMYFLAKQFFGKAGAALSSILYLTAPYRALNVYVRGALAESFSLAILPILWLYIYKTIKSPTYKNVSLLALIIAAQLSTHNISTMLYVPFSAVWALFWLYKEKKVKKLLSLIISGVLGFGLAAFFIIPAFVEKNLIQEEIFTTEYSFYAAHFVSLKQLFLTRFWGYGGSVFGTDDHMSFQVGFPHWILAVVVWFFATIKFIKTKSFEWALVLILLLLGTGSLFMAHQKSYLIWENISILPFVQFPWRFIGLGIFFISFAGGALGKISNKFIKTYAVCVVILCTLLLNAQYFKPESHFFDETDATKLSGELFLIQQKSAPYDYLPKTVKEPPEELAPDKPQVVSGVAEIKNFSKTSSTFFFDANVYEDAVVNVPIIYFPNWEVYIIRDHGLLLESYPDGNHGTLHFPLPEGNHMIHGRFVNTQIRKFSNAVSLITASIIAFGALLIMNKKRFLGIR